MSTNEKPCGAQPQGFGSKSPHQAKHQASEGDCLISNQQIPALQEDCNTCAPPVEGYLRDEYDIAWITAESLKTLSDDTFEAWRSLIVMMHDEKDEITDGAERAAEFDRLIVPTSLMANEAVARNAAKLKREDDIHTFFRSLDRIIDSKRMTADEKERRLKSLALKFKGVRK